MTAATSTMPTPAPLHVEGLSLRFGGIHVLEGLDAVFEPGRITGLIGPNGAGKTSFFNCLTGLYLPQEGRIRLGGTAVGHLPPNRRAMLGFARSFQHVALCPELSCVENVMAGMQRHARAGWLSAFLPFPAANAEREAHRELARQALERVGAGKAADALPAELPPGMLRLVEIARAIVGKPQVLLLDEPAAGLNSAETAELAAVLLRLRQPDLVLLVVEHDMDLIMGICDTIHVLSAGRMLAHGTPADIRANPEVVRVYLGDEDV